MSYRVTTLAYIHHTLNLKPCLDHKLDTEKHFLYFFCPLFALNLLKQNPRQNFCLENLRSLIRSTSFMKFNLGSLFEVI